MLNPVRVERHLQRLCRLKLIRPHHLVVGLTILWNCRQPGREEVQVSYDRLATLAGVCRRTAVEAVGLLCRLGVLAKEKTRLKVAWALGTAWRQGRNIYRWRAIPECMPCATIQQQGSKKAALEVRGWRRLVFHPPIRTVAEQLALLKPG